MKHFSGKGFSTLEILLAGAIFVLFSWGVIEVVLSGLQTDRLGRETTVATGYATEGLEAIRAIKEDNFDALTPTAATGIDRQSGFLVLSGSDNVLENKYTRTIRIDAVERDGDGNIVGSDGSTDTDTVRVTVTVAWQVTPTRDDSVVLQTYFTRWRP